MLNKRLQCRQTFRQVACPQQLVTHRLLLDKPILVRENFAHGYNSILSLILLPSAVPQVPQQKSVPTLKLLLKELYKIADKWEEIGIHLEVGVDLLDKVKSENDGDSKKCLRELLKILVKMDPLPSWTDVVEALESLEEEELAQRLKDKYC